MNFFNFSRLANASAPLFSRYSARNFWPLSPLVLAAMLERLEVPARRSKLQISGIQPGCSVLLCDEAQQCEWLKLASDMQRGRSNTDVALLSPLGMALIGKNVGDDVTLLLAGKHRKLTVTDIIRVQHQPGSPRRK